MPTYTFLLFRGDDSALTLDAVALDNDRLGVAWADHLLAEHLDCECVEIWEGDRAVLSRRRAPAIPGSVISGGASMNSDASA